MGTALLAAVERDAAICGVLRLWLITSNDNLDALRFYQNRGWDWVAVHRDAITEARRLKPEIPALTVDGVAIRHEIEMEKLVGQPASDIESRHSGDSDF
jgi:DNA-3-methyladenine glycosylase I